MLIPLSSRMLRVHSPQRRDPDLNPMIQGSSQFPIPSPSDPIAEHPDSQHSPDSQPLCHAWLLGSESCSCEIGILPSEQVRHGPVLGAEGTLIDRHGRVACVILVIRHGARHGASHGLEVIVEADGNDDMVFGNIKLYIVVYSVVGVDNVVDFPPEAFRHFD